MSKLANFIGLATDKCDFSVKKEDNQSDKNCDTASILLCHFPTSSSWQRPSGQGQAFDQNSFLSSLPRQSITCLLMRICEDFTCLQPSKGLRWNQINKANGSFGHAGSLCRSFLYSNTENASVLVICISQYCCRLIWLVGFYSSSTHKVFRDEIMMYSKGSDYIKARGIFEEILNFIVVWLDGVGFAGYPLWGEVRGSLRRDGECWLSNLSRAMLGSSQLLTCQNLLPETTYEKPTT